MSDQYLKPVSPSELCHRWPAVRDRLAELLATTGEGEIVEEVYADCKAGNSYLWALDDNTGFVVLEIHPTRTGPTLFVAYGWNDSEPDARHYLEQIKGIAESNDCNRVRWVSDRRWERHLPGSRVRYLYEVDLEGEI